MDDAASMENINSPLKTSTKLKGSTICSLPLTCDMESVNTSPKSNAKWKLSQTPKQKQEYSPKCQAKPKYKTETSTLSQRLNETAKMESANLPPKTNAKTHPKTLDHRDQHTFQPNAKMNAKISAKTDQPLHRKTSPL